MKNLVLGIAIVLTLQGCVSSGTVPRKGFVARWDAKVSARVECASAAREAQGLPFTDNMGNHIPYTVDKTTKEYKACYERRSKQLGSGLKTFSKEVWAGFTNF